MANRSLLMTTQQYQVHYLSNQPTHLILLTSYPYMNVMLCPSTKFEDYKCASIHHHHLYQIIHSLTQSVTSHHLSSPPIHSLTHSLTHPHTDFVYTLLLSSSVRSTADSWPKLNNTIATQPLFTLYLLPFSFSLTTPHCFTLSHSLTNRSQ